MIVEFGLEKHDATWREVLGDTDFRIWTFGIKALRNDNSRNFNQSALQALQDVGITGNIVVADFEAGPEYIFDFGAA